MAIDSLLPCGKGQRMGEQLLSQLFAQPHALGGHGFDHLPYNTLSPKAQAADMHRAVRLMNQLFGTLPRALAYPFGRFTSVTAALARACGYIHTFTTEDRVDAKFVRDEITRRANATADPRVDRACSGRPPCRP